MRRRALLACLGAGTASLAGCPRYPSSDTDRTGNGTPTFTFEYTTVGGGELAVEPGAVEAPDLDWAVEKLSDPTEDHPCRPRIAVTNEGPERDLTVEGELPYPVVPGERVDGDVGIQPASVPADSDHERRFDGNC